MPFTVQYLLGAVSTLPTATVLAAASLRASWARGKIAALAADPSDAYAAENAALGAKGARLRIVLIGDSRIARWPRRLLPDAWEVINRGIGGETSVQTAGRFETDALALAPDVLVIGSGVNDIVAAGLLGARGAAALEALPMRLSELATRGAASGALTLTATIARPARPPFWERPFWPRTLQAHVDQTNLALRAWAQTTRDRRLDCAQALSPDEGQPLAAPYAAGALHFSDAAYAELSRALLALVEAARPG